MINLENEFKLVEYKKRRHRQHRLQVNEKQKNIYYEESVDVVLEKVNVALEKFKESPFYQTLFEELKKSLEILNFHSISDIICYGLGNFSEHICSKYQLAALLCMKSIYSSNVSIYDPIFTKTEIECLEQLNLQIIQTNEEGKRIINDRTTLVFMPHCSKHLTNNFLYANWTPLLHNCILLGNSWSELESCLTDALLEQTVCCIYKLQPYVTEIKIKNNFHYPNTFSGTSFHIFTKEKLDQVPSNFWITKPDLLSNISDPELVYNNNTDKKS